MLAEIKIALNYILSFLYDKLPRRRVNLFGEELEKYLRLKLSLNWNVKENAVESASVDSKLTINKNNCLTIYKMDYIDPCLIAAAKDSAMDLQEILQYLPNSLKLYINPGLVALSLNPTFNSDKTDSQCDENLDNSINVNDLIVLYNKQQQLNTTNDVNDLDLNKTNLLSLSLGSNQNTSLLQIAATSPSSSISSSSSSSSSASLNNNNNTLFKKQFQNNNNNNQKPLNLNLPFQASINNNSISSPLIGSPSNKPFANVNTVDLWLSSSSSPPSVSNSNNPLNYSSSSSSSSSSSASSTSSFNSNDFSSVQDLNNISNININNNNNNNSNNNNNNNNNKTNNNSNKSVKQTTLPQSNTSNNSLFTTASFAQTKFGSTKSKNYIKPKQNKMLPNEFSAYIKQKSQFVTNSNNLINGNHSNQNNFGLDNFNNYHTNYLMMNQQLNHQHPNDLAGFVSSFNQISNPSVLNSNLLINDSYSFDRFQQDLQSLNNNQALLNLMPANNNHNNNSTSSSSSFYQNLNNILPTVNNNNNHLNQEQSDLTFNLLKDIIDDRSSFDDLNLNNNMANDVENNITNNNLADKLDHLSLLN